MRLFHILFRTDAKDWSDEASILFSRSLAVAKYVGVLPYDWNSRTQKLEYSKSLTRFVIFITQYLLCLMYEGFVIYRCIHVNFYENAPVQRKTQIQYAAIVNIMTILLHSCSVFNHGNLHNFVNRLLSYVRDDFQRLPEDGRKLLGIGKFIRNMIPLGAAAIVTLNTVILFQSPTSPHLLTTLVPDVSKRQGWEMIPFALIHGYLNCNRWAIVLFYCTLVMSCSSATLNALNRTRPNPRLSEERFFRATRKLEVLQGNYNALFRWVWWVDEVILTTLFVLGICGAIWNEGAQAIKLLVVAIFVLGAMLTMWKWLGEVFETSSQVHWEWRRRCGLPSILFRKRIKSMRPIRVEVGGYFYVDAAMSLTLLSIMSENTFTVLLAA